MDTFESRESWFSTGGPSPDVHIHVHGVTFRLNRKNMISRSAKVGKMIKESQNQYAEVSFTLTDVPANAKIFELVVKFCNGHELELSAENAIPLACTAFYLEMTEDHSTSNLLKKTLSFFHNKILPDWNETVKALRTCENVTITRHAAHLGLIDACFNSIAEKARKDPHLLGKPIKNRSYSRPNATRKLFAVDCWFEDLTTLALWIYEPAMLVIIQNGGVPPAYVAGSLFRYAKKRADVLMVDEKSPQREMIEVVEKLLPEKVGVLPCNCLVEMLRWAIAFQASYDCRRAFEVRIGNQLDEATVDDLLIPCMGYSTETGYDVECVMRILKNFYTKYANQDADRDPSGLIAVSEIIDDFSAEIARDVNLKQETFKSLVEKSAVASSATGRCSDGVYRAIDVYLASHNHLTDSERDELCQALDCHQLTSVACEHAARNERLPLRVVVQVLFVGQLKLRDAIAGALPDCNARSHEEEEDKKVVGHDSDGGLLVREEMERMNSRVIELEKECCRIKRQIVRGRGGDGDVVYAKRLKTESLWKEVKRKLGCVYGLNDSTSSQAKKVH